jgi:hypothetical protein
LHFFSLASNFLTPDHVPRKEVPMSRPGVFLLPLVALLFFSIGALAQKRPDPVATELAVQAALQKGRQLLAKGQPRQAVEVLEARLSQINGNADYLAVLRNAYAALIREFQLTKQDDQIPPLREKLKLLEMAAPKPADPDPPPSKARGKIDPFQQEPLMGGVDLRDLLRRAEAAFGKGQYREAGQLFAQVHAVDPAALGPRGADWAYCRLAAVVERLNGDKPIDTAALAGLNREVNESLALAATKPELVKFGRTVQARLRERQGPPNNDTPIDGWTTSKSVNFRLLHHLAAPQAEKLLSLLEKARTAAFEKWHGAPTNDWSARCDVFVHSTAAEYAKATGKDPRAQGHATIDVVDRRVTRRRIDLAGDDPDFAVVVAPREVTHVVLADLFPDPMLPRWADEAMAILAEPREHVQRYLRALPKVSREKHLIPLSQLLPMNEFPEAATITAFYVESVSVVDLLVAEKGPQHFSLFLQQAQRYGFEKALKESYGYKNVAALQEYWQKKAFAATE